MNLNQFQHYNPLVNSDRRLATSRSEWVQQFSCTKMKPLIICRGPIRKETMDVFSEMGIEHYGILLSEKDSVTYPQALAPELRSLTDPQRVHRVQDYTGSTKEDRQKRIKEIIQIAKTYDYNSIFAGYGFMSEDADMVSAMEEAHLIFIGPGSHVQAAAGLKDEAKRTAAEVGVSVTPGVDDATTRTLLKKAPTPNSLVSLASQHGLDLAANEDDNPVTIANRLLDQAHSNGIDIYSLEELIQSLTEGVREMFVARPHYRIRLKAISGGGGKGQRILKAPLQYTEYSDVEKQVAAALEPLPSLVREVLAEVKCLGQGDNKNVVAELNIEETSHQEIQVVGNGDWCLTLGGRDCSLQMHEQKLLEVSVTEEELLAQLKQVEEGSIQYSALQSSLLTLRKMEDEATRFGSAVGLDSVSTFECIVSENEHYFMEMNTRIQVEHRVTELCYSLRFTNPENDKDYFEVTSLVELMVLIAQHKKALPKPTRVPRFMASVEARINATNDALKPHAGGIILDWSKPLVGEVRDDQGISSHNPDTGAFMRYHLAGAYDSNIALLLTVGSQRKQSYENMAEVFRLTKLEGDQLCTNLHFHYGLIHWFMARDVYTKANTKFVSQYLTAVGALYREAKQLNIDHLWSTLLKKEQNCVERAGGDPKGLQVLFDRRSTLILRPVRVLLQSPHLLSGWLSFQHRVFDISRDNEGYWQKNPLKVLKSLYHFLNLEWREDRPALQQIWKHDDELLKTGLAFYDSLERQLDVVSWEELCLLLDQEDIPSQSQMSPEFWLACRQSHYGHQLGLEVLAILNLIAKNAMFFDFSLGADGKVEVPERFKVSAVQEEMLNDLAPPPIAKSGELVAVSGGMFYPREAPDQPKLIDKGVHFEEGQPLYIIEVMKMFNKVYAPFAGTITDVLIEGEGVIIKKGQPLFKVKPDHEFIAVDQAILKAQQAEYSEQLLNTLLH